MLTITSNLISILKNVVKLNANLYKIHVKLLINQLTQDSSLIFVFTLLAIGVNVSVDSAGDAINSDGFFLEAAVVVLEAPGDRAVWVFFAILPQNLCDGLLWLVVRVVRLLVGSLVIVVVVGTRSRCGLWLGKVSLLRLRLGRSRSVDVETLCV